MASVTRSPGTVVSDSGNFGAVAWSNPGNCTASDDTYATATIDGMDSYDSEWIKATNFGFTIPSGAITGVKIEIEGKRTATGNFEYAQLVIGGTVSGTNNAAGSLSDTEQYHSFGGDGNLWSLSLSDTDINSSGFGCVFGFSGGVPSTWSLDHIQITVYYTAGGGTAVSKLCLLGVG